MDKKEMEKLIEKYQKKADAAGLTYQETGEKRYYRAQWTNQDLADTLRIALTAKEDFETLRDMKIVLSEFASRGATATSPLRPEGERVEIAMMLAEEIAIYGKRNGLIL